MAATVATWMVAWWPGALRGGRSARVAASISIRSQQTSELGSGPANATPSGVPGAASNQPPVAATAPLTGASQPLQAAQAGGVSANGRREATTNYEIDKTVRVTRNASGLVKRLNAAVVVNNRAVTDAKGKTTQVPLGENEADSDVSNGRSTTAAPCRTLRHAPTSSQVISL